MSAAEILAITDATARSLAKCFIMTAFCNIVPVPSVQSKVVGLIDDEKLLLASKIICIKDYRKKSSQVYNILKKKRKRITYPKWFSFSKLFFPKKISIAVDFACHIVEIKMIMNEANHAVQ